jgi:class 3 adenylate cyclase/tetratricopeptide (TPR) repeat protein
MECRKCLSKNPAAAKFCIECGAPMEYSCHNCGTVTPLTGRFCMGCGSKLAEVKPFAASSLPNYTTPRSYTPKFLVEKILTTRSAIEGERKLVTVLFADVADFTAISEKLDPEDVHQIMDGTFRILIDEVHRFEGTINQFTGDGVMALFGAPVAHEDHALRACHAALCIQNSMQSYSRKVKKIYNVNFALRIGLNSGLVIVGAIGDDLRMDYTAEGETTNTAARMQSLATPASILVSRHTRKLAEDYFEFKYKGKLALKGKAEPQDAFELIKPTIKAGRLHACMTLRELTKFVGRQSAVDKLMEAYREASSGAGRIIGIVGEPGVGKSRLLLEFQNLLPTGDCTYIEGHCLHYGDSMAYLPVLDVVRSYFGIVDGDREPAVREKLENKLVGRHESLRGTFAPLHELLSLKTDDDDFDQLDPKQKRLKTVEAVRDLAVNASREKTLVIALEDLHWIDRSSEEFINYFIECLPNSRILLILLYRPEYRHQWQNLSYYSQISLGQLSTESSVELLKSILQDGDISPELGSLILDKAAGNPLFLEEFTQTLMENGSIEKREQSYTLSRGVRKFQVPDTIQGIIAARMDRLEDNIKRTMQIASVIGRDFTFGILQIITGFQDELRAHLLNLQSLEFIYQRTLFPELEYTFKHALTQEVAYHSLLTTRQKELHRKIGKAMESCYSERLVEFSSIIAEHFLRGEVWEGALHYLVKAGDSAARLFALPEARKHYARSLMALDHLEPTDDNRRLRVDIIIKFTLCSWRSDDPSQNLSLLTEAEALMKAHIEREEVPDSETLRLARVHFCMGRIYYLRGDMIEAIRYFKEVLPVAQKANDPQLIAIPSGAIGQSMEVLGNLTKAKALLEQAIPLFEKTADWAEWIDATAFLGTALAGMGEYAEGVSTAQRAFARARELKSLSGMSVSGNTLAFAHLLGGDLPQAMAHAKQAIETAEESGDRIYSYVGYSLWGWAAGRAGDLDTATACMAQALKTAEELGGRVIMTDVFTAARAEITFLGGHLDEALALAQQAVAISQAIGAVFGDGVGRRTWGMVLAAIPAPDWNGAEAQMAESLRVLESGRNLMEAARTWRAWGFVCRDRGVIESAVGHWSEAANLFKAAGATREFEEMSDLIGRSTGPEPSAAPF